MRQPRRAGDTAGVGELAAVARGHDGRPARRRGDLTRLTDPIIAEAVRELHEYARKGGHTRAIVKQQLRAREFARCLAPRDPVRAAMLKVVEVIDSAIGAA